MLVCRHDVLKQVSQSDSQSLISWALFCKGIFAQTVSALAYLQERSALQLQQQKLHPVIQAADVSGRPGA